MFISINTMHRLFYIKFYDDKGKFIVREDYSGLQFANKQLTEKYIQHQKKMFEVALDVKLKLNPHHKAVPDFTIRQLIGSYCKISGNDYANIVGKGRKREYVNIRMFITKTALELGFVHGQLRPFFTDGISYHYESSMNDLIDSNDMVVSIWRGYEDKAMSQLIEIKQEDGSGVKIESNE